MQTRTARSVSFADVPEGLRQTRYCQIMRGRHPPRCPPCSGAYSWTRQAERVSQHLTTTRVHADAYAPPIDIATLTHAGRPALDRLIALERMCIWPEHSR